jgi:hypothetical protein
MPVISHHTAQLIGYRGPVVSDPIPDASLFGCQRPRWGEKVEYIVANLMHKNLNPDGTQTKKKDDTK